MINPESLPAVRSKIRELVVMPDDEPADVLVLAAFLANHVPGRELNMWFVLVGPPDNAKTEIVKLLIGFPTAYTISKRMTGGFLLSSRAKGESGVFAMDKAGARCVIVEDMAALSEGVDRKDRGSIFAQLLDFHDGHMIVQTGLDGHRLEWGPKKWDETIGWIGAATQEWYKFSDHHERIGDRFLAYWWDKSRILHWTDHSETSTILRALPGKDSRRDRAKEAVHAFLRGAIAELEAGGLQRVEMPEGYIDRVAAAARFVGRILGAGKLQGTGSRRAARVLELSRLIAFMGGRTEVSQADLDIGIRVMLSQLPPEYLHALAFAGSSEQIGRWWTPGELFATMGGGRSRYYDVLTALVDATILEREVSKAKRYGVDAWRLRLHPDVARVAAIFDPQRRVFRYHDETPAPVDDSGPSIDVDDDERESVIDQVAEDIEVPVI